MLISVKQLLDSSAICLFNRIHHHPTHCVDNLEYSLHNSQTYDLPRFKYQYLLSCSWCLFYL